MADFPDISKDFYPKIHIEDTDQPLPKKMDHNLRYAYFKTIAKGGKCLVQSCKDMFLNRHICYKSLLPEFTNDAIEQQRFIREARVTAMLQHPNTIPTYELGRDPKGRPYFTMKLVHGYTLREVLDYRDRYDLVQLMDIIIQVAHALEYAHTHGVVHRDIKPENILIGPYGEVVVLDWGLAKVRSVNDNKTPFNKDDDNPLKDGELDQEVHTITMEGKLQGTLCYMSPEQVVRNPGIDGRSDLFSLGVIMYELLTGVTPCVGNLADTILRCIKEEQPKKPSSVASIKIPSRLEYITMKLLEKDPANRLSTASELIRILQEGWSIQ